MRIIEKKYFQKPLLYSIYIHDKIFKENQEGIIVMVEENKVNNQ